MALPDLRHFTPTGGVSSDPVEALVGEAWGASGLHQITAGQLLMAITCQTEHYRVARTMPKYTGPAKPQKPAPKKKGGKK
jgi:hypothetical protein